MTELLEALYLYACEQRVHYTREETAQRCVIYNDIERIENEITNLLTPQGLQQFETYLYKRHQAQEIELECIFRTGLSIGQELSRQ